jgi:hypothetical protein
MPRRKRHIDDINALISATVKLRRELERLVKKYPEDDLDPDDRIFNRLTSLVWRKLLNPDPREACGDPYRPYQKKESEAIKWNDDFNEYLKDLDVLSRWVMPGSDLLGALPLIHFTPLSAKQLIVRLRYQEGVLRRTPPRKILSNGTQPFEVRLEKLRSDLKAMVRDKGIQYCSDNAMVNRDTITDLVHEPNRRPHKKTVEKLESFIKSERP